MATTPELHTAYVDLTMEDTPPLRTPTRRGGTFNQTQAVSPSSESDDSLSTGSEGTWPVAQLEFSQESDHDENTQCQEHCECGRVLTDENAVTLIGCTTELCSCESMHKIVTDFGLANFSDYLRVVESEDFASTFTCSECRLPVEAYWVGSTVQVFGGYPYTMMPREWMDANEEGLPLPPPPINHRSRFRFGNDGPDQTRH